jgi:hypothetical protein
MRTLCWSPVRLLSKYLRKATMALSQRVGSRDSISFTLRVRLANYPRPRLRQAPARQLPDKAHPCRRPVPNRPERESGLTLTLGECILPCS